MLSQIHVELTWKLNAPCHFGVAMSKPETTRLTEGAILVGEPSPTVYKKSANYIHKTQITPRNSGEESFPYDKYS